MLVQGITKVVAHAIYDAWGNPLTDTYPDSNFSGLENTNNYTGYTYDETLDLYFAQNRFYAADLHRFTQEDIIKDGNNWYAYCGNNPTGYVDVTGEILQSIFDLASEYGATITWSSNGNRVKEKDLENYLKELYSAEHSNYKTSSVPLSATVSLNGRSKTYAVAKNSWTPGPLYVESHLFQAGYDVMIDDLSFAHDWNYVYNSKIEADPNKNFKTSTGYIEGQAGQFVKDFKYGNDMFENVGCEIIAIYNAMNKLGIHIPLADIADYYEHNPGMWHWGHWGTKYDYIGNYLNTVPDVTYRAMSSNDINVSIAIQKNQVNLYYETYICYSLKEQARYLDTLLTDKNALIVSFWTKPVTGGIHTVLIEKDSSGQLYVHNVWNGATDAYTRWATVGEFLSEKSSELLYAYLVSK